MFELGENVSVHTYEMGVVSGEVTTVKENLIVITTNDGEDVKVLI